MERLELRQEGTVLTCTLNRPDALNAVDAVLHEELEHLFLDLGQRDDVHVVVLTGAGRAFCAGGDVREMVDGLTSQDLPGGMFTRGALRLVRALVDVPQVVIAYVNGPAIGLGATIALLSDIVIASEDAIFSDPHVSVGLVAGDGGAVIWPLLMGLNRAKEYLLTGDRLSASEAHHLGLVNHVYASGQVEGKVAALADRLAASAPAALRWTKASMNKVLRERVNLLLDSSLALEALSAATRDHHEGVHAFVDKRPPRFEHR